MVESYGGQAIFVSENWGDSKLAARFGIEKYPVVFVEDALVARPEDFGGWGRNEGRYAPWRDPANHAKFKRDLARMIDLALKDGDVAASAGKAQPEASIEIAELPSFAFDDIKGSKVESASVAGKVVIVEFWATWCAPCRPTLKWLEQIKNRYGDKVEIVAIALESEEAKVLEMTASLKEKARVAMGSDEIAARFGTITSVPTMFVFNRQGKVASVFYGAPPMLHQKAARLIDSLVK